MDWTAMERLADLLKRRMAGYQGALAFSERNPTDRAALENTQWHRVHLKHALECALKVLDAAG